MNDEKRWLAKLYRAPLNPVYRIRQLQIISYAAFMVIGALIATIIFLLISR